MDLRKRATEVLEQTHLMSLGTQDESGVWVSDVIFVFDDDFNLYWMSNPACRHSGAVHTNKNVSASITASTQSGQPNFGIQCEGVAEKIEGARHDLALKHFAKRSELAPNETDDVLQGDSWYVLKPTRIRLIDEANFGFDTQDVL